MPIVPAIFDGATPRTWRCAARGWPTSFAPEIGGLPPSCHTWIGRRLRTAPSGKRTVALRPATKTRTEVAVSLKSTFGENSVGFYSRAGAARALGVAAPARSRGARRATSLAPFRGRVPTQRAALPALSPDPRVFQGSVFCGREHYAVLFVVTKTRTWEPFPPAAPPLAPRFAAVPVAGRAG